MCKYCDHIKHTVGETHKFLPDITSNLTNDATAEIHHYLSKPSELIIKLPELAQRIWKDPTAIGCIYLEIQFCPKCGKPLFENEKSMATPDYQYGYNQACTDLNTEKLVIQKDYEPSRCPTCHQTFHDYETCQDGYYQRPTSLERCPHCGQKIIWYA